MELNTFMICVTTNGNFGIYIHTHLPNRRGDMVYTVHLIKEFTSFVDAETYLQEVKKYPFAAIVEQ